MAYDYDWNSWWIFDPIACIQISLFGYVSGLYRWGLWWSVGFGLLENNNFEMVKRVKKGVRSCIAIFGSIPTIVLHCKT